MGSNKLLEVNDYGEGENARLFGITEVNSARE